MAAEYEPEVFDAPLERQAESVVVDGMLVCASFGGDDDDWALPEAYTKQFASAVPEERPRFVLADSVNDNPEVYDPRGNEVTDRTLQREVKITLGGGNSKGRRAKAVVPIDKEGKARTHDQESAIEQRHLGGRFAVYGLSRGEAEFYLARPGEARSVLMQHVARVTIEGVTPERMPASRGPRKENFSVYGLGDEQVEVLRAFPGSARTALASHAHAMDRDRIRTRDGAVASVV